MSRTTRRKRGWWLVGIASLLTESIALKLRGYPMGGKVIVRCRRGHLFTTWWLPGISFKALRLGWWRFQRCPIGRHWSFVTPVRPSELTQAERDEARRHRDLPLP